MQTFSELKSTGFSGISAELTKDFLYLEQLASSTQADISNWPVAKIFEGVKHGDKRAINKLFFERTKDAPQVENLYDEELLKDAIAKAITRSESTVKNSIISYRNNAQYYRDQAVAYHRNIEGKLKEALHAMEQADALEQKNHTDTIREEFQKLFSNPFWEFVKEDQLKDDPSSLFFRTRKNIILTEKNPAAGVDRRIDFGRYKARIYTQHGMVKLLKFQNNVITNNGYYHPYVAKDGEICWGTAADTAYRMMSAGKWGEVMALLSSLLSTYSGDTTPWFRMSDFEANILSRQRAGQPTHFSQPDTEYCGNCELPEDDCRCNHCERCDNHQDDCECSYCERCGVSYGPDDDGCGGIWCPRCEECTGPEPCETHYCSVCSSLSRSRTGGCSNDCCEECGRIDERCNRCRECGRHEGEHDTECSNAPSTEEETNEEVPF